MPLGLLFTPLCVRLAGVVSLVDVPRADRFHARPTPKLGGLAVALAALPAIAIAAAQHPTLFAFAAGAFVAFLVGLIDDARRLSPPVKLGGQLIAAGISAWLLVRALTDGGVWFAALPLPLVVGLAVVWLVTFQNAVNFLDNMDGIAAGISGVALAALALHAPYGGGPVPALAVALACCGFLPRNTTRPAAQIFLGDAGALFLGHAVGFFSLLAILAAPGVALALAPLVAVLIPLLDIAFVTIIRIREGRSPAVGGRDHTTHRIFRRLGSVTQTRRIFWAAALLLGLGSLLLRQLPSAAAIVVAAVAIAMAVVIGVIVARFPPAAKDG